MANGTRVGPLKLTGWLMVAVGVLVILADFADSEHTFRAFRNALKEGFYLFLIGVFILAQAGFTDRIHRLERENAELRAAKGKPGSTQGEARS